VIFRKRLAKKNRGGEKWFTNKKKIARDQGANGDHYPGRIEGVGTHRAWVT